MAQAYVNWLIKVLCSEQSTWTHPNVVNNWSYMWAHECQMQNLIKQTLSHGSVPVTTQYQACCSHVDFRHKNMMVLYPPDALCVPLIFLSAIAMALIFWCRMSSGLSHGDQQFCNQKPWPSKIWAQQCLWSLVGSNLSVQPLHRCQQPKLLCFQPHMQSSMVFRRIYVLQFTTCLMLPLTV